MKKIIISAPILQGSTSKRVVLHEHRTTDKLQKPVYSFKDHFSYWPCPTFRQHLPLAVLFQGEMQEGKLLVHCMRCQYGTSTGSAISSQTLLKL